MGAFDSPPQILAELHVRPVASKDILFLIGPPYFFRSSTGSEFQVKVCVFEKATKFDEISILLLTNILVFFVPRYSFEHQSLLYLSILFQISEMSRIV